MRVDVVDDLIMHIADEALAGNLPQRDDVMRLLRLDPYSVEASYVCARARELGMRACSGRGYVYAQIGVDENPCPENCRFCSFAAVNRIDRDPDETPLEMPIGRIVHYAKLFADVGVSLVSLMATAGLNFGRYLDMVRAVRASVPDGLTIMANCGDLSAEQARLLKEAGADAAYHALRLGEGQITDIDPVQRKLTFRHLRLAGIPLMTGIEPVWRDADIGELADRICDLPELGPFCMGACNLTPVSGADVDGRQPALTGYVRLVAAIARLACGDAVPVGGIGGIAWVDAGCDPRERGYGADDATLRARVSAAKRRLALDGFC